MDKLVLSIAPSIEEYDPKADPTLPCAKAYELEFECIEKEHWGMYDWYSGLFPDFYWRQSIARYFMPFHKYYSDEPIPKTPEDRPLYQLKGPNGEPWYEVSPFKEIVAMQDKVEQFDREMKREWMKDWEKRDAERRRIEHEKRMAYKARRKAKQNGTKCKKV